MKECEHSGVEIPSKSFEERARAVWSECEEYWAGMIEGNREEVIELIAKALKQVSDEAKRNISEIDVMQAIARAWCYDMNAKKIMDSDLALAATAEVMKLLCEKRFEEGE